MTNYFYDKSGNAGSPPYPGNSGNSSDQFYADVFYKLLKVASFFAIITFAAIPGAIAAPMATCSNLIGQAYYVANNLVKEEDSGWMEDRISDGVYYLQSTPSGYDIFYTDSRKKLISSVADGAKVVLLSRTENDAIFLVHYGEGSVTEVYKFFKDSAGEFKMSLSITRSNVFPITKIAVLVGDCSGIEFHEIK